MPTEAAAPSARLIVRRNSDSDMKVRSIYVSVDGKAEKALGFGDSAQIQLKPGSHELKATNRLFTKRVKFDIEPGEAAIFRVANKSGGCLIFLAAAIGGAACRLSVERIQDSN
jgi:hypothetical protein